MTDKKFPPPSDYKKALQNPHHHFYDDELKQCDFEKDDFGLPKGYPGSVTITFHLHRKGKHWAVRCFKKGISDLEWRYKALGEFIKEKNPNIFVRTECLEKGIIVKGESYPIIKMQWVEGSRLDQFLIENYSNSKVMTDLSEEFRKVVHYLEKEKIAHGDLQHGNIIIKKGKIVLIDYDGVFLPEIKRLGSSDKGHGHYQHPDRDPQYNHHIDRFSAIVIYLSLIAIAENPKLFEDYNKHNNIIFIEDDFKNPKKSEVFNTLLQQESTHCFCESLMTLCKEGNMDTIPSLEEFISQSSAKGQKSAGITPSIDISSQPKPAEAPQIFPNRVIQDKIGRATEALASYDEALALNPNNAHWWSYRGDALNKLGRHEEAVESCDKALKINPDYVGALVNLGNALDKLGRYEEAIESYDKALKIKPDYAEALYNRGSTLDELGRHEEAVESYEKALEIRPDYADAWHNHGLSLEELGRYSEAVKSYDRALKINPNDLDTVKNREDAIIKQYKKRRK
jgi:tetratricopeptide (TPR) repeat protein